MSFRMQAADVKPIILVSSENAPSKQPVLVSLPPTSVPSNAQLQDQIKQLQSQLQELSKKQTTNSLAIPNLHEGILLSYSSPMPSPRK